MKCFEYKENRLSVNRFAYESGHSLTTALMPVNNYYQNALRDVINHSALKAQRFEAEQCEMSPPRSLQVVHSSRL
jgi:hypothetical protein